MNQLELRYTVNDALEALNSGQLDKTCRICEYLSEHREQRPDVLTIYGMSLRKLGRLSGAEAAYMKAITLDTNYIDAYRHLGSVLLQQKKAHEAVKYFCLATDKQPGNIDLLVELSNALNEAGDYAKATQVCQKAIGLNGSNPFIYTNLGNTFYAMGDQEQALACYTMALELSPGFVIAAYNQALTLEKLGRVNEAIHALRSLIASEPKHINAHIKLGDLLKLAGNLIEAEAEYISALALDPTLAALHNNLGTVYAQQAKWSNALKEYINAKELGIHNPVIYQNIGDAYHALRQFEQALESYREGLLIAPNDVSLLAMLVHVQQKVCDWRGMERLRERLLLPAMAQTGNRAPPPFVFLGSPIDISPNEHYVVAKHYADFLKEDLKKCFSHERRCKAPHELIKIGYVSADFHNHATAHLMLGLFRRHDRSKVEITAYSMGSDDGSFYRQRIQEDCDRFVDISALSDLEAARKIYADNIDILVDLKGYTGDARPRIFAYRPAPIQVAYLGYPGTMGADFIDYVLADRTVVPLDQAPYYAEKPAYLPNSYQVNDTDQPIAADIPSREACGLPRDGFVFCCFNAAFKMEPQVFALWMRILQRVPDSVLWLQGNRPSMVQNLRQEAEKYAIDPARLVFAGFMPKDQHLARLQLADLFLDTYFYNAHTTASDALWAGAPVLTRIGHYFPSRVAASLLKAIGLDELIVTDAEAYVDLAVQLAHSPEQLQRLRTKLQENRTTWPLFDTDRFVRALERLYYAMWQRWLAGLPPAVIEMAENDPVDEGSVEQRLRTAIELYQKEDYPGSLRLCQSVLADTANRVDAWTLLGMLYRRDKNTQQAIAAYQKAIEIDVNYADAHNNLANIYREEGRYDEAIASYLKAVKGRPAWPELHSSIAAMYQAIGRLDEAFHYFGQALQLAPDNPDIHWDYALCLLLAGRYAEGWQEYEWRWRRGLPVPRGFSQPFWQGEMLSGKTLLVYDEQGYGDGIQFLRFIPLLERYGGKVILEVLEPLHALIRESMEVDELVARGDMLPAFDYHIPLLSLPRVLNITLETIPSDIPYLRAPADRIEHWRQRLVGGKGLRVALTWAGNPNVKNDHWRSPRLQPLLPLLDTPDVTFYSIQMGDGRRDLAQCADMPPNFIDLGDEIHNFSDTAAILSQLDLLITSDTSAAHLAGAVGCKAWIMLHSAPDWRWMLRRRDSLWYPTLTLYRQAALGHWADVIGNIKEDLESLVNSAGTGTQKTLLASHAQSEFPLSQQTNNDKLSDLDRLLDEGARLSATDRDAAKRCFERCVAMAPYDARGWEALANAHHGLMEIASARDCLEKALELRPDEARLWMNFALVHMQEFRPEQAYAALLKAKSMEPESDETFSRLFAKAHSNFLCDITYDPDWSREAIFAEHRRWYEYNRLPPQSTYVFTHRPHRQRLRLGLVSADFYSHPVGVLLYSVMEHLNRDRFEVYCYAGMRTTDSLTASYRDLSTVWRDITALTDVQLAECIYMDAIDILIDLSGHTAGCRLRAFTCKPAPVQVSFLGYWDTTGVPEIDYVISDGYSVWPEDEPYFVEQILRLPYSRFCYRPPSFSPEIRLKQEDGPIVFGSFNNDKKLNRHVVCLWSDILKAVDNAKLLLKWRTYASPARRAEVLEEFAKFGIGQERLILEGASTYDVLLDKYNDVDIALDPFPFSGGLTTCDALWMGTPVVTLTADRPVGRQSSAMLHIIGCPELVAACGPDYTRLAIELASDKRRIYEYKQSLRNRLANSALLSPITYAKNVERIIDHAWDGRRKRNNLAYSSALQAYNNCLYEDVLRLFESNIQSVPDRHLWYNLSAISAYRLGDTAAAESLWRKAIAWQPGYVGAYYNFGTMLKDTGRLEEAEVAYLDALRIDPYNTEVRLNLGALLYELGRLVDAEAVYMELLRINPDNADVYNNLGTIYVSTQRPMEAEKAYREALRLKPAYAGVLHNLGNLLRDEGRLSEAERFYRRAIEVDPGQTSSRTLWHYTCQDLAIWTELPADEGYIANLLRTGRFAEKPFRLLSFVDISPSDQREAGIAYASRKYATALNATPLVSPRAPNRPLRRIGYLSADFWEHATMHLLGGVLERHDRERFDIFIYAIGNPRHDAEYRRAKAACTMFRDLSNSSDILAAEQIAKDEIDILIDLKGYTTDSRLEITARRPAPVVISWLGYPGSLGHHRLADYIIGDPFVTPIMDAKNYSETLALMPYCYQPNDQHRKICSQPSRKEAGLPPTGFVFGSFNQIYKINANIFRLWCRLLAEVPGSILWLLAGHPDAEENLRREAELCGISSERLIFAPKLLPPEHRARLQLIDLALDTFPYTSHTTASDLLWAGVPLVTKTGDTFASRVAGSLLHTLGLIELITVDDDSYFTVAITLAHTPERLAALRAQLSERRLSSPLFDSDGFRRDLEKLYCAIWEQEIRGARQPIALNPDRMMAD